MIDISYLNHSLIYRHSDASARKGWIDSKNVKGMIQMFAPKEKKRCITFFIRELEDHSSESLNAIGKTFNDLADHLEKHYLIPPEYVNG
jgi:hypothetical protein